MAATPAHGRGGNGGVGGAGLPTVSPYSTSSDGRGQSQQQQPAAHVVIPSPALT